ncbi:uncharacterized protein BCR38DRAFT_421885 [Pseudomassariella vexata]|uniref:Major facilitator superfamily domain-containing protein n=1 Tax=Pseudomassariella vexata TaxID=1141098 RepID=A0A1Y2EFN2_9PEZI|nr:uncharacterized protein BCR38DRAFT_421885 [Pseudomassariella vexata]ORY70383.1 hypothetical protein BCR38DRAFT_421885 [Pseudomassariella vexata]
MLKPPSLAILVATGFMSAPIISCTMQFLTLFASKWYHIRLADTGYILTCYGIFHVVVVLTVIPWITTLVVQPTTPRLFRIDEKRRDLVLARWSFLSFILGTLIIGLSPSLTGMIVGLLIMSLGSGQGSLIRSTTALYVDPEHRSRLYTLSAMVEQSSSIYSDPMLAGLFTLGMRMDGGWIGLPYFGVSVLCLLSYSILGFVRVPNDATDDVESESGSDRE